MTLGSGAVDALPLIVAAVCCAPQAAAAEFGLRRLTLSSPEKPGLDVAEKASAVLSHHAGMLDV
jgi:hypothetical protein